MVNTESRFNLFGWRCVQELRAFVLGSELQPADRVVVFPSFIFHEFGPFYGRDTRITVATNCWFT